jgi:tetratricopeptide (TPR) repeat protein
VAQRAARALPALVLLVAAVLLLVACPPRPAPVTGPRIGRDDLPYLLPPSTGFARPADAELLRRVDSAFDSALLAADTARAKATAEAALAVDPGFAPAEVLRGQALLVDRDLAGARAALDPVVARYPDYSAAGLAAARAAELAGDPAGAYAIYRRLASVLPIALERAGDLHEKAVAAMAARVEDAVARNRLAEGRALLDVLREWAPMDRATLEAAMDLARVSGDAAGELDAVRGLLASALSGEEGLLERRGELELQVGQPSAAIEIFTELLLRHPSEPRFAEAVDRAKFRWRVVNLPADVQRLVDAPELSRADFSALLYWLVPGVRAAVVSSPHIASDILDHPRRQEIMRVVNLHLMDLDEALRRFNPDWKVHRAQALKALERVLQRAQPAPSCVVVLEGNPAPSREAVCGVAVACGMLPETADCLPEAGVSGGDAAAWIRRTVSLLP